MLHAFYVAYTNLEQVSLQKNKTIMIIIVLIITPTIRI